MTIASLDDYIGATKVVQNWYNTVARTTVAFVFYTLFDVAGSPKGVLAGTNTANGVVPTDATVGYCPIPAFSGTDKGYLSRVEFACSVAARISLSDRLFLAGAYPFNANVTLASQPSYAGRIPNGDYNGTEIWLEWVTASTGTPTVTVTYTNQDGVTGRTTGAVSMGAAMAIGRMVQLPLQQGDTGVQKIESVVATVATGGTFNVMVLRPLWAGRAISANIGDTHDLLRTGMPEVFDTSALFVQVAADSTSSGIVDARFEIASS